VSVENAADQSGSCAPAKRSYAGKRKGNVASNDSNPTQLCSIKLAKCIKKE